MPISVVSDRCCKAGQSLIESCIVIGLTCLIFLGIFQLSQIFAAKEFLTYAAARGVRAKAVGLNNFMTWKTVRVGSIPNAGLMLSPEFIRSPADWHTRTPAALWVAWTNSLRRASASEQYAVERSRIPLYLGAETRGRLPAILDYADWDTIEIPRVVEDGITHMLSLRIRQEYPLRVALHRAFYADDILELAARSYLETYYPLYLGLP